MKRLGELLPEVRRVTTFPPELDGLLGELCAAVDADEALLAHVWALHREAFTDRESEGGLMQLSADEALVARLPGRLRPLFLAAPLVANIEALQTLYRRRGIDEQTLRDTLADLPYWMAEQHRATGVWSCQMFGWLRMHMAGKLFRLGRMQFAFHPFPSMEATYCVHILRHNATGRVAALSEDGLVYRRDGYAQGQNGIRDDFAFAAVYREQGNSYIGHLADPVSGRVAMRPVALPRDQWTPIVRRGDVVMDIHVPSGIPLTVADCAASFQRADAFFAAHFPETPWEIFFGQSWILSPQLDQVLPERSNLARFQRQFYHFPALADDARMFERVFPGPPEQLMHSDRPADVFSLPRGTSLQRNMLDFLAQGNEFHCMNGFFCRRDAAAFGRAPYAQAHKEV
ncbi:MAG: acyltransferase domain-containing protein [Christensenellales bacterium]|jgi:hypothetical protein